MAVFLNGNRAAEDIAENVESNNDLDHIKKGIISDTKGLSQRQ